MAIKKAGLCQTAPKRSKKAEAEPMNEQFDNVAEIGSEGDAADKNKVDVEIR